MKINNQVDISALMAYSKNSTIIDKIKNTNNSKISSSVNNPNNEEIDQELLDACKSFETYLVEQVLKGMRDTIPKDDKKSDYDYFDDILYKEYATAITEQGELGLYKDLYNSMKRNYGKNS